MDYQFKWNKTAWLEVFTTGHGKQTSFTYQDNSWSYFMFKQFMFKTWEQCLIGRYGGGGGAGPLAPSLGSTIVDTGLGQGKDWLLRLSTGTSFVKFLKQTASISLVTQCLLTLALRLLLLLMWLLDSMATTVPLWPKPLTMKGQP